MTGLNPDTRRAINYTVVAVATAFLTIWLLYLIRDVLLVLYVAALLALGCSPMVAWIERRHSGNQRRRRMPRWGAILLLYVGLVGTVAAVLAIVIPPLIAQTRELWQRLPEHADQVQQLLVRYGLITHRYTWSEVLRTLPNPGGAIGGALGGVLEAARGVAGVIAAIVTILVLPYYFLLEATSLEAAFLAIFKGDSRARVSQLIRSARVKVGAWMGGQLLLSFIIGSTAALGLWLLGVPYFYVLALLCAFGELIPVVGPILAGVPSVLVALTVSIETGVFTAIYFIVQQFVENHFLVPRVMQRQVGVSAVTVIAALLIGSELLGLVGALLAVPTAAIVQVVVQEFMSDRDRMAPIPQ